MSSINKVVNIGDVLHELSARAHDNVLQFFNLPVTLYLISFRFFVSHCFFSYSLYPLKKTSFTSRNIGVEIDFQWII